MMKSRLKKILSVALLAATMVSCVKSSDVRIPSLTMVQGSDLKEEYFITRDEELQFYSFMSGDYTDPTITYSTSDPKIATVTENGLVKGISVGTCILKATSNEFDYLEKSVFINVSEKRGQIGVGSGKSKDDPIFIGDEGKEDPLEIYFIEMQQIYSDSIFIQKGDVQILIDAGYAYDGKYINKFLKEHMKDDTLDVLMVSHPDGDHIMGLPNALTKERDKDGNIKNFMKVNYMIDYGGVGVGEVKTTRERLIKESNTVYHSAIDCVNFANGATNRYYLTPEFYFDVLNTGNYIQNSEGGGSNPNSLALIFHYKDFSFYTAGDLTSSSESTLLKKETLPEVTLAKASHHGSSGSNSQPLLNTLNPKAVAISAARAHNYGSDPDRKATYNLDASGGHPAAEAIGRIYKAPKISENLNVYWNAINGTMKFETDGRNDYTFQGSTPWTGYYDLTLTNGVGVWDDTLDGGVDVDGNPLKGDFKNKVKGEENKRLHETKVFQFRKYIKYLPTWAQKEYFPDYTGE